MASTPERHGSGWRVRWRDRRTNRFTSAKVSDEAAAWAVKVYVESRDHYLAGDDPAIVSGAYLERSAATKARAISFAGFAERHIAERAHKLGEATAAIYRRIARDHLADWAERPVAQITTTDLEVKKKRVRLHRTKDGHRGSDGGCADHAEWSYTLAAVQMVGRTVRDGLEELVGGAVVIAPLLGRAPQYTAVAGAAVFGQNREVLREQLALSVGGGEGLHRSDRADDTLASDGDEDRVVHGAFGPEPAEVGHAVAGLRCELGEVGLDLGWAVVQVDHWSFGRGSRGRRAGQQYPAALGVGVRCRVLEPDDPSSLHAVLGDELLRGLGCGHHVRWLLCVVVGGDPAAAAPVQRGDRGLLDAVLDLLDEDRLVLGREPALVLVVRQERAGWSSEDGLEQIGGRAVRVYGSECGHVGRREAVG